MSSAGPEGQGPAAGDPTGVAPEAWHVFTVPNALTAMRLACLPFFVWLLAEPHGHGELAAGFLLGSLGITDTLDGHIARHFHQESRLGKIADPLVDRLMVLCAVVGCALVGALPWWLLGVVLAREVVMLAGGVFLALRGVRQMDVSRMGKAGALGMMIALPWFLMGHAHFRLSSEASVGAWVAAVAGVALAWAAAAGYVPRARRALAAKAEAGTALGKLASAEPGGAQPASGRPLGHEAEHTEPGHGESGPAEDLDRPDGPQAQYGLQT